MEVTVLEQVSLKDYNTLGLNSVAALMAIPHSEVGLVELVSENIHKRIIVLGKGSNILLSQDYYDENTIFVDLSLLSNIYYQDGFISVQAGATLSKLVWFAVEKGIVGFEFLEDIPGTVGGAIIMNAGTYRDYISNLILSVRYYDYETNQVIERKVEENDFARRYSFWSKTKCIIMSASFKVSFGDNIESIRKIASIKESRFLKQPRNYPNAGSVFVRPKKDLLDKVVWELIDAVGLRGFRIGGAEFSKKHPGFILNLGDATFDDVNSLITTAQTRVSSEFGICLKMEWKII